MKKHVGPTRVIDRTLTPATVAAQRIGSVRVAPGIWLDADGGVHFSVPELLALVALPNTPANRAIVTEMLTRELAQTGTAAIIRQQEES
jgi:hypothetical protein